MKEKTAIKNNSSHRYFQKFVTERTACHISSDSPELLLYM